VFRVTLLSRSCNLVSHSTPRGSLEIESTSLTAFALNKNISFFPHSTEAPLQVGLSSGMPKTLGTAVDNLSGCTVVRRFPLSRLSLTAMRIDIAPHQRPRRKPLNTSPTPTSTSLPTASAISPRPAPRLVR